MGQRALLAVAALRAWRPAVQLGEPLGTLAAFAGRGCAVRAALARRVGVQGTPPAGHRARPGGRAGGSAGTRGGPAIGSVATDLVLLAQTEVGELREDVPGRGGSSTLPHKRNPVGAISARAAAITVPGLVASLLICGLGPRVRARRGLLARGVAAHLGAAAHRRLRRGLARGRPRAPRARPGPGGGRARRHGRAAPGRRTSSPRAERPSRRPEGPRHRRRVGQSRRRPAVRRGPRGGAGRHRRHQRRKSSAAAPDPGGPRRRRGSSSSTPSCRPHRPVPPRSTRDRPRAARRRPRRPGPHRPGPRRPGPRRPGPRRPRDPSGGLSATSMSTARWPTPTRRLPSSRRSSPAMRGTASGTARASTAASAASSRCPSSPRCTTTASSRCTCGRPCATA